MSRGDEETYRRNMFFSLGNRACRTNISIYLAKIWRIQNLWNLWWPTSAFQLPIVSTFFGQGICRHMTYLQISTVAMWGTIKDTRKISRLLKLGLERSSPYLADSYCLGTATLPHGNRDGIWGHLHTQYIKWSTSPGSFTKRSTSKTSESISDSKSLEIEHGLSEIPLFRSMTCLHFLKCPLIHHVIRGFSLPSFTTKTGIKKSMI